MHSFTITSIQNAVNYYGRWFLILFTLPNIKKWVHKPKRKGTYQNRILQYPFVLWTLLDFYHHIISWWIHVEYWITNMISISNEAGRKGSNCTEWNHSNRKRHRKELKWKLFQTVQHIHLHTNMDPYQNQFPGIPEQIKVTILFLF